ncbi:SDR family oxidoreductase [Simiduia agarivorans]|uniref:Short chain dehydrogenase family protein n=1 Tax=Simiduia agarivorans (strain DSM 21679 / JCM 13881 / BCRC 17597 / SA1) TaxID=1117647 RepID=K4KJR7_SIMAS|nr:SDR family oxidoreductase [Simiduia agarivorans]AFU98470.1 short chain dehydrogenase family protein [Simiduia agarivorans SA1 = DSM 21679]
MHVVITGASRGIGLALASQYAQAGHQVTALVRQSNPSLEALAINLVDGVDVTGDCADLAGRVRGPVDVLINNAGLLESDRLDALSWSSIERQLAVNAIGTLKVTHALLPLLGQGAKVAMITSRMGSVADNGSGAYYGYRMSKAALNSASKSLAIDLAPRGIAVAVLHPGFVQTEMVNYAGDISADEAASRLRARIEETTLANTGEFRHSNGEPLPW